MNETLITFGEAVKALDDSGRVGGYLVRFGGKDLDGEFFSVKTYFGAREGDGADCLFHHSLPIKGVSQELTDHLFQPIKTKKDDIGVFAETVLNLADEYEAKVYEMVQAGKLGWSSGSSPHTVRKSASGEILRWPIIEGSLTPTPADHRNRGQVVALKSLIESEAGTDLVSDEPAEDKPADNPPDSRLRERAGKSLAEEWAFLLAQVEPIDARTREVLDLRIKAGRTISAANREIIKEIMDRLNTLYADTEPKPSEDAVTAAMHRYAQTQARISEVLAV